MSGMHRRYDHALVIGKFEPFHAGHLALIEHAAKIATNKVYVILVKKSTDQYDPKDRALSIYESLPMVNLKLYIVDDIYADDDVPEHNALWGRYTEAILGFRPQVVVASEEYAKGWAASMNADYVLFDQARLKIPVSGTLCRENATKMSDYLPMATKRYTLPRIVVVGAESTGTTTLCADLAKHYDTEFVPELGHLLGFEALAKGESVEDESWNDARFWLVSRGQDAMEERAAGVANGLLICDTDSLATALWYLYYMKKGVVNNKIMLRQLVAAGWKQAEKHSLYIVTSPKDVPFEDDGTRTGEDLREWMHERFLDYLRMLEVDYIVVEGTPEERLAQAVAAIDKVIA